MRKDRLLESYIRSYLIKESISSDDHDDIEDAVSRLKRALSSRGMSLETLNFSPKMISKVRDKTPVKDLATIKRDKPESYEEDKYREESQSYSEVIANQEELSVGLGFNPIDKLKYENSYYLERVQEFIKVLDTFDRTLEVSNRSKEMSDFLKKVIKLKEAIEEADLKIVGSGIYRIVLIDPNNNNFVIKIGLSDKGRQDCRNEIEFSMGRGKGRIQHTRNFPTIYHHDQQSFSWYAIEKVLFIENETFNNPPQNFFSDIKEQFRYTFRFLEKLKYTLPSSLHKDIQLLDVFEKYISTMFNFKKDEIKKAHLEYAEEIRAERNNKVAIFLKNFLKKVREIIFGANLSPQKSNFVIPEQAVYDELFKKRMTSFVENFSHSQTKSLSKAKKVQIFISLLDELETMKSTEFNRISQELFSLFDQAVVTNLRDIHLGNVGFKKVVDEETYEEKWRLIFTDIDSN